MLNPDELDHLNRRLSALANDLARRQEEAGRRALRQSRAVLTRLAETLRSRLGGPQAGTDAANRPGDGQRRDKAA